MKSKMGESLKKIRGLKNIANSKNVPIIGQGWKNIILNNDDEKKSSIPTKMKETSPEVMKGMINALKISKVAPPLPFTSPDSHNIVEEEEEDFISPIQAENIKKEKEKREYEERTKTRGYKEIKKDFKSQYEHNRKIYKQETTDLREALQEFKDVMAYSKKVLETNKTEERNYFITDLVNRISKITDKNKKYFIDKINQLYGETESKITLRFLFILLDMA